MKRRSRKKKKKKKKKRKRKRRKEKEKEEKEEKDKLPEQRNANKTPLHYSKHSNQYLGIFLSTYSKISSTNPNLPPFSQKNNAKE